MTTNPSERLWAQAVEDGNYAEAAQLSDEAQKEADKEARRQRLLRAFGAVIDPEHLLYPGPTLPREFDCIDRRQYGTGEMI